MHFEDGRVLKIFKICDLCPLIYYAVPNSIGICMGCTNYFCQ